MAAFTVITALPTYVSQEQHKELVASTPASFSDIPPVLRHTQQNVSINFDPPSEEFPAADSANGTLYVIESALVFMSSTGRGIQVEYPTITLHAVSRAESGPSIYCQLDESPVNTEQKQRVEGDEEEVTPMRELSIVPADATSLDTIFEALSYCASLHPDPAGVDDMDDDDDAFIDASAFETFNGDEAQELSEVGRAALAHLESIIYNPFENTAESQADAPPKTNGDTEEGLQSAAAVREKETAK